LSLINYNFNPFEALLLIISNSSRISSGTFLYSGLSARPSHRLSALIRTIPVGHQDVELQSGVSKTTTGSVALLHQHAL
jgi:hypothetical protein